MPDDHKLPPALIDLTKVFLKIGFVSFGGPAGQIALMHRILVADLGWVEEEDYLRALNFCTLLPGPEAQQLATYIGWKLHGWRGGLIAGLLFVIPGALIVLALSALYAYAARLDVVTAAFLGVKAALLSIIVEALLRLGRRALNDWARRAIALAALLAIAVFQAPFPLVIAGAGLIGAALSHVGGWGATSVTDAPQRPIKRVIMSSGLTAVIWGAIWAAPLILIALWLGPSHVLFDVGLFFSQLALVTFGGAYAVLTYMAQEAVTTHGWLGPREMVDGLGLAETTPGPLILVTEFVGFLAAFRAPAPFTPLVAGLLGALVALWTTFAPCFLWIFTTAPFVERLSTNLRLQAALAAITAAVVGVIANLTAWFAAHVLFTRFVPLQAPLIRLSLPDPTALNLPVAGLALFGALLLFRFKAGVLGTLGACASAAVILSGLRGVGGLW
ncbi:chromate efflux transporter [Caulobacter sp. RHG1]|uniref:chromate efflux transporter n=1 Tax=Caulobacter sp. (strain RHG1) TaxID=2545762 RepID=UPI0019D522FD|nr:Chromate transport protein ChrA [Caulobacter sp. RHG1]